jgi:glycosyltransferase involved in cell wall biosynthesis
MTPEGPNNTKTLVIVPAFNEEGALPGVLEDLRCHGPALDVLVIDDGSSDDTARVARTHGVRVARLPFNLGVGGALQTGFRYALEEGYERAVQFDGDGQHSAREIPKLLEALSAGADLVVGSRFAQSTVDYQVGRVRWGAMRVMRLAVRVLSGRSFYDASSGFRAFSHDAIAHFARAYPEEYLGDTVEALLMACYLGLRVVEVPASMRQRSAGVPSTRNLKLAYHYTRLMIVIVTTASRRGRRIREGSA